MPTTRFQRVVFAFMSVAITVHVFVFYNLAIAMGGMSNRVFVASRGIVGKEFACAFLLEIFVASPLSMRIAFRAVNPREEKPYVVTTAIICATVGLMCPMMSLIATILYDGINVEFFAHWMQKMFINFPLAFFSQLFFIQPFVRFLFGAIFGKQTEKARASA